MSIHSIGIVIINLNLKQDTIDCIESLLKAGAALGDLLVVDNGSTDGSIEAFRSSFGPELEVIALGENLGFAKGSNVGIQRMVERGTEWIFLMNNDTYVAPDFIERLEEGIQKGCGQFRLFSPAILFSEVPDEIWYLGDRLVPGTMITVNPYYKKNIQTLNVDDLLAIDFVNGCGMLVHCSVYQQVGMLDTSYFIYNEEVDFCWRARSAGYKMAALPKAKMWHKISSIMKKQKPRTRYLQARNQIWTYRRHSRGLTIVVMFFFSIWKALRNLIQDLRMGQPVLFFSLWKGWWEGWTRSPHQGEY